MSDAGVSAGGSGGGPGKSGGATAGSVNSSGGSASGGSASGGSASGGSASGGSASGGSASCDTNLSDDPSTGPWNCPGSSFSYGQEGDACSVTRLCNQGSFGVRCTTDFINGAYLCACTRGESECGGFVAKFPSCESVSDDDFLNRVCGFKLRGDGVEPEVVLVGSATDPAFATNALTSCREPEPFPNENGCSWSFTCVRTQLSVSCGRRSGTGATICECSVDGRRQQSFEAPDFELEAQPSECPELDLAWMAQQCGWEV